MFNRNGLIISPRVLTSVQENSIIFQEGMIWYNITLKSLRLRLANTTINIASTANIPLPDGGNFLTEVSTEVAMLALLGSVGDYAYRTDLDTFFIISSLPPTVLANWSPFSQIASPIVAGSGLTDDASTFKLGGVVSEDVTLLPSSNSTTYFKVGSNDGDSNAFFELELFARFVNIFGEKITLLASETNLNGLKIYSQLIGLTSVLRHDFDAIITNKKVIRYNPLTVNYNTLANDDLLKNQLPLK
jgi:hypothetical protein